MIVIEDLKVSNMSKSAAGTTGQPGRNVRAKSGLNRSILDQGWFELRRQLEYKQAWRGGQVLAINPAYTSQQCACCGHTERGNRQTQNQFKCVACGYEANADVNGARNILAAGHAVLACGGAVQLGRPVKQEPGTARGYPTVMGIPLLRREARRWGRMSNAPPMLKLSGQDRLPDWGQSINGSEVSRLSVTIQYP